MESMVVKNINELLVQERMEEILKRRNVCHCEQCQGDIMAYALNQLPPRYVNSEPGALFKKLEATDSQSVMDIDVAISKAIEVIKKHPRH